MSSEIWGNKEKWNVGFFSNPHVLLARCLITIGATGAPTIAGAQGVTISRTSAGLYALSFPIAPAIYPAYHIVKSTTLSNIRGTALDASAGTASFQTLAGVAVDMTDSSGGTPDTTTPYTLTGAAGGAPTDAEFENALATLAGVLEKMPLLDAATDPANGDLLAVDFWVRLNTDAG